jgi:hypothetical protein
MTIEQLVQRLEALGLTRAQAAVFLEGAFQTATATGYQNMRVVEDAVSNLVADKRKVAMLVAIGHGVEAPPEQGPTTLPMLEAEGRKVAGVVDALTPHDVGFTLLLFNYSDEPNDPNNFTTYLSSADRPTMVRLMQELLAKWEAEGFAMAPVRVKRPGAPRRKWKFGE